MALLRNILLVIAAFHALLFGGMAYAAPAVTATDRDTLQTDENGDGKVNRGDVIRHTIVIGNTGTDASGVTFSETVDANTTLVPGSVQTTPLAANHSYSALGNVRIQVPAAAGLLLNSFGIPAPEITTGTKLSANSGNVTISADGSFTYNPPAGFEGTDTFTYTVTNARGTDTGTVSISVSGMIWFVDSAAAAGDGRLNSPFNCLPGPGCLGGAATDPNDTIFLYSGTHNGTITLKNSQKLIGQGAGASLSAITGLTPPTYSDGLPATGGTNPKLSATGNGVVLASGNTLRGFNFDSITGIAVSGTNFGTLTLTEAAMNNTTGAGLSLTTGTANATFTSFTSAGGTNNVSLTSVSGTITLADGAMTGATGAAFVVNGGTVSTTYSGNITQASNAALVSVSGGHATGTITFQTGTLSATNGTGLQFDNADGTYTFTGTTTLNGGDAGIDISNGSAGTFSFGSNSTITSPTGIAFNLAGGTATVTYSGNITQANNAALVSVSGGHATGTITFQTGTLSATNGTGLQFDNADGTYNFTGTTTLNGGDAGIDISNGSAGTFSFGSNSTITSPTGIAFNLAGGTATVTYSGNVTQANNAALVSVSGGHATGTITFQTGTLSATNGTGLQFDNADGTYTFTGTTTLNGGDAGIDISNGSAGTFSFGTGTTITNPSGIAYREDTSTAPVTYSGTIMKNNNAASAVNISNKTGGTTAFNNTSGNQIVASTATANAINVTNNTGATVTFGGGLTLNTTSGVGFNATGGGTISATQNNTTIVNTISTTTGTALNVSTTTIGGSGLTFRSISAGTAASGPANGIVLNNTGASAGLTVTGNNCTGQNGSGGTIQKTTGKGASFISAANISLSCMNFTNTGTSDGADPANSTGTCGDLVTGSNTGCTAAIHLETVTTVLLDQLVLDGGAQQGINGYNVTGLTLSNSQVKNFGNNTREDGLRIKNLLETSNITSTVFDGNEAHQARIENNSGTLNLTVSGNTFSNSAAPNGVDGLMIASHGNAVMTVNAQNNTYKALRSDGFFASADGSSSMNVTVQGSTFNTASPATTIGAAAVDIVKGGTSSLTFDIKNNTLRNNGSHVINLLKQSTATGGTFSGKITGNTIGTNGQETSGTTAGSGIRLLALGTGILAATVDSNNIYGVTDRGIEANLQEESSGSNALEVKISNNNISTHYYDVPSGVYSMEGIYVNAGVTSLPANDAGTVCADISGNTVSTNNSASSLYYSIRLRQRFATTMRLPGYPGANSDITAVSSFISGKNTVNYGVSAQVNTPTGGGFTGGAACSTPALP